jgi:hypothetical protein
MGDKSLMKSIILIFLSLSILLQADLSVKQIQSMVNKIHQKRDCISLDTLLSTKEPFVRLQKENNITTFVIPTVETIDVKLILHAIVNGRAYINDAWMKVDETILGYELKAIGNIGVVLRNENHIKKLYRRKKKKNSLMKFEETN